ncbi:HIT family protein [Candidatus Woesearchaeota archaeon]|nr:HIT family protein [Candidatus Woesearchaeota archaeon]
MADDKEDGEAPNEQPAQQGMTPEQVAELQEKIKNMSPEELREFQKKQCIFCHIVSGKVQSKKIFEDDSTLAILDINPANPGHVLVLPKEHYSIMPQLSEEEIAHLFMVVKTISNGALRALAAGGVNVVVQNGIAAGQKAQHFMVHIIPRKDNDGLNFELPQKEISDEALEALRVKLAEKLGSGVKQIPLAPQRPKMKEFLQKKAELAQKGQVDVKGVSPQPDETIVEVNDDDSDMKMEKWKKPKGAPKKRSSKEDKDEISLDDIAKVLGG